MPAPDRAIDFSRRVVRQGHNSGSRSSSAAHPSRIQRAADGGSLFAVADWGPRGPHRTGQARRTLLAGRLLTGLLLVGLSACSNERITSGGGLKPGASPQSDMVLAVSTESPDERRAALARVARSRDSDAEWAIEGYFTIATLERDSQSRCVALRALARTRDPRAVSAALLILNANDAATEAVAPPDRLVRADAALLLAELCATGAIPDEQARAVRGALLRRLADDPDRHTRLAAARGLRCYPELEILEALIQGLRDRDFAVVYECEDSLVALTGNTHNCDPAQWRTWLDANRAAPFSAAGARPSTRRPPYDNQLEKMGYDLKQMREWLWPGAKP
jgi:hypothetical protein